MTDTKLPAADQPVRKPHLALMGEFSAGKSSLTNLLLGRSPLPVQVTATRLPPVWISHGEDRAEVTTPDGGSYEIALDQLNDVSVSEAELIRVWLPSETLELCDLIDMPGISDPNMPSDLWQRVLPDVDSVIWCTPATQAWRQSETAFWNVMQTKMRAPSTLLITHADKLLSARDKTRVMRRVTREVGAGFGAVFALSLTEALAAGEDPDAWQASGADRFVEHLIELLLNWEDHCTAHDARSDTDRQTRDTSPAPNAQHMPEQDQAEPNLAKPEAVSSERTDPPAETSRILPRRVRPVAASRGSRPNPPSSAQGASEPADILEQNA